MDKQEDDSKVLAVYDGVTIIEKCCNNTSCVNKEIKNLRENTDIEDGDIKQILRSIFMHN